MLKRSAKAARPKSDATEMQNEIAVPTGKAAKTKKKRKFSAVIITVVIVAGLCYLVPSMNDIRELRSEKEQLLQEQQALAAERDKLQNQLEYSDSAEYIEQQARAKLGLIMPGEISYAFPDQTQLPGVVSADGSDNANGAGASAGAALNGSAENGTADADEPGGVDPTEPNAPEGPAE